MTTHFVHAWSNVVSCWFTVHVSYPKHNMDDEVGLEAVRVQEGCRGHTLTKLHISARRIVQCGNVQPGPDSGYGKAGKERKGC